MNILLVCAGGISTSFLVQNIKKAMQEEGIVGEIKAKPITAVHEFISEIDVVLIAPQALFLRDKVEKVCSEQKKPWGVIDSAMYGSMNGEEVLNYAIKLMDKEDL